MKKHTESPERLGFLSGSRKNDRRRRRFVYILVAANPLNSSWHSTQQAHQINAGECVRIDSVRADASLLYNLVTWLGTYGSLRSEWCVAHVATTYNKLGPSSYRQSDCPSVTRSKLRVTGATRGVWIRWFDSTGAS